MVFDVLFNMLIVKCVDSFLIIYVNDVGSKILGIDKVLFVGLFDFDIFDEVEVKKFIFDDK